MVAGRRFSVDLAFFVRKKETAGAVVVASVVSSRVV